MQKRHWLSQEIILHLVFKLPAIYQCVYLCHVLLWFVVVLCSGFDVFLSSVLGDPTPTITWYHNGRRLEFDSDSYNENLRMILPTGQLFFLQMVHTKERSYAGSYYCEASNAHGTVRSREAVIKIAGRFMLIKIVGRFIESLNKIINSHKTTMTSV